MSGANVDLRAEIDALQHHCNVLAGQNVELNTELERFVETDEQIRNTLNRRDRVETLRHHGEYKMRESYANLERASPRRGGRGASPETMGNRQTAASTNAFGMSGNTLGYGGSRH